MGLRSLGLGVKGICQESSKAMITKSFTAAQGLLGTVLGALNAYWIH